MNWNMWKSGEYGGLDRTYQTNSTGVFLKLGKDFCYILDIFFFFPDSAALFVVVNRPQQLFHQFLFAHCRRLPSERTKYRRHFHNNLQTMVIQVFCWCWYLAKIEQWFSALCIVVIYIRFLLPVTIRCENCTVLCR